MKRFLKRIISSVKGGNYLDYLEKHYDPIYVHNVVMTMHYNDLDTLCTTVQDLLYIVDKNKDVPYDLKSAQSKEFDVFLDDWLGGVSNVVWCESYRKLLEDADVLSSKIGYPHKGDYYCRNISHVMDDITTIKEGLQYAAKIIDDQK